MPRDFKIDFVPPLAVIGAAYGRVAAGFRTFRVPLTVSVERVLIPSILENFQEGGRPIPWEPLSEETQARRERQDTIGGLFGSDILVETGRLFGAMGSKARWHIDGREAYISNLPNSAWYGALHQGGDDFFNVNFPARQFAVIQREDEEAIVKIFDSWIAGNVITNWSRKNRVF